MKRRLPIKEWNEDERPREKLKSKGAQALSNAELLAIILGSGTRDFSAVDVARELIATNNNSLRELARQPFSKLMGQKGIGPSKAVSMAAVFEISKRFFAPEVTSLEQIRSSSSAASIFTPILRDLGYEECWVMYLNRANRLIAKERLSMGGVSATVVDVKIIVKNALEKLASSLILVHNHPSGNPVPGENDKIQTKLLKDAAALFDISLLDHLIIAGDNYFSFADDGMI
jgi:DNA repair protein RadC